MKNRYKKAKRILTFYYNHFGLKPPYKVLICGTFCKQALVDKINIAEQLPKYLGAEVKLYTTKCAIKECELGGCLLYGPYKVLTQFDIAHCPHAWFKGAARCLRKTVLSPGDQFLLATQDDDLQKDVREHNIPLLHISHNSINLEAPSDSSKVTAEEKTSQKLMLTKGQEESILKMKQELGLPLEEPQKKKRKRPKGPNPLACKKKKKTKRTLGSVDVEAPEAEIKKKRKRKWRIRKCYSLAYINALIGC